MEWYLFLLNIAAIVVMVWFSVKLSKQRRVYRKWYFPAFLLMVVFLGIIAEMVALALSFELLKPILWLNVVLAVFFWLLYQGFKNRKRR